MTTLEPPTDPPTTAPPDPAPGGTGRIVRLLLADRPLVVSGILTLVSLAMIYATREWNELTPGVVPTRSVEGLTPNTRPASVGSVGAGTAPDGGGVTADATVFRWRAVSGAVRYELDVFDDGLATLLTKRDLRTPAYAPTEAERAPLESGAHVWWRVVAFDENDRPIARSARAALRGGSLR